MKQLLIICGSTATGKTELVLHLAKKFNGELISADSRQVYKGMDIGTGKELPVYVKSQMSKVKSFGKMIYYYTINGVKVWGYDLIEATEAFSVGHYLKIARKIIKDIWVRGKLPILVGGSGLYIKAVVDGIPTAVFPKSLSLRKQFKNKSVEELQEILGGIDPFKLASMNTSDRGNSRRLIRAIEIISTGNKIQDAVYKKKEQDTLFIGLTAPKKILYMRVEERVAARVKEGIKEEIKALFKKGVTWEHQSMQAMGYRQWEGYFEGKKSIKEVISDWKKAEKQYVRRQMTWFKKDKRIVWFDISKLGWKKNVEKKIKEWYSSN